jgi:hypothetical protein
MKEFNYVGMKWKIIDFLIGFIGFPIIYWVGVSFFSQVSAIASLLWIGLFVLTTAIFGVRIRRWAQCFS